MNQFDNMREAIAEARQTLIAADNCAGSMAAMLVGRLRKVANTNALIDLKRELKNFNIHTGEWMR